jgi:dihydroorotase
MSIFSTNGHHDKSVILIKGGRIIDPANNIDQSGDLLIENGKIAAVGKVDAPENASVIEATGKVVAPGFIDLHCHLREPGQEEKETIATGTAAAARGGFTAVCAMPNTTPALDNRGAVEYVTKVAKVQGRVRVYPIGAITKGRKGEELAELADMHAAGAIGFSDDGAPVMNSQLMRNALQYSTMLNVPIIQHCEDSKMSAGAAMNEGAVSNALGLKGWPNAAEEVIVARDIALARLTGGRVHLAHISTAGSVNLLRAAIAEGLPISAEVTPHHLTMNDEWVAGRKLLAGQMVAEERQPVYTFAASAAPSAAELDTAPPPTLPRAAGVMYTAPLEHPFPYDTNTKVNPPLRAEADRLALVAALADGTIVAIATDHAPHTIVDKQEEYGYAAFGISGLETAFGALMALVHTGAIDLPTIIARLTSGPAHAFNLPGGSLSVDTPADVVILDPDAEWTVDPAQFASKGQNTPLAGVTLRGKVLATIVGGEVAFGE